MESSYCTVHTPRTTTQAILLVMVAAVMSASVKQDFKLRCKLFNFIAVSCEKYLKGLYYQTLL